MEAIIQQNFKVIVEGFMNFSYNYIIIITINYCYSFKYNYLYYFKFFEVVVVMATKQLINYNSNFKVMKNFEKMVKFTTTIMAATIIIVTTNISIKKFIIIAIVVVTKLFYFLFRVFRKFIGFQNYYLMSITLSIASFANYSYFLAKFLNYNKFNYFKKFI